MTPAQDAIKRVLEIENKFASKRPWTENPEDWGDLYKYAHKLARALEECIESMHDISGRLQNMEWCSHRIVKAFSRIHQIFEEEKSVTAQEAIKKTLQRTRIHGEENSYRLATQNVELDHDCRKLALALELAINHLKEVADINDMSPVSAGNKLDKINQIFGEAEGDK